MSPTETNGGASVNKVVSPSKLAHVVIRTNKMEEMKRFYVDFLGGRVAFESGPLAFIAYDDEHHRIGLLTGPGVENKTYNSCGLEHIAFTFDSLRDLCTAYKQRKALGMEPLWCVNHGPTTSIYYHDPDGNVLETQVDNFDDAATATEMMTGPLFAENFIGTDFDPDALCKAVESGADEKTLKARTEIGPRGAEAMPAIVAKFARTAADA